MVGGLGNGSTFTEGYLDVDGTMSFMRARREVSRGGWFRQRSASTEGYLDVDGTMSFYARPSRGQPWWVVWATQCVYRRILRRRRHHEFHARPLRGQPWWVVWATLEWNTTCSKCHHPATDHICSSCLIDQLATFYIISNI